MFFCTESTSTETVESCAEKQSFVLSSSRGLDPAASVADFVPPVLLSVDVMLMALDTDTWLAARESDCLDTAVSTSILLSAVVPSAALLSVSSLAFLSPNSAKQFRFVRASSTEQVESFSSKQFSASYSVFFWVFLSVAVGCSSAAQSDHISSWSEADWCSFNSTSSSTPSLTASDVKLSIVLSLSANTNMQLQISRAAEDPECSDLDPDWIYRLWIQTDRDPCSLVAY